MIMRLWHESLIPHLPRQQLLGQHRECCALRGKGWGRPHATVNYAFQHPIEWLVCYHYRVMSEMLNRGYQVDNKWFRVTYRGKSIGFVDSGSISAKKVSFKSVISEYKGEPIYPEHNDEYLQECLDNLRSKGIEISL